MAAIDGAGVDANDVVIGIAASGTTLPYVHAALDRGPRARRQDGHRGLQRAAESAPRDV